MTYSFLELFKVSNKSELKFQTLGDLKQDIVNLKQLSYNLLCLISNER